VLARVLERIGKGDTLVVVRIDRLARSLSHLLEVIERLEAICTRLEAMRERTPRGRTRWQPSYVKMLLERAERLELLE
jgi:DNA invertase Pin-like site-specific DNA recombinase